MSDSAKKNELTEQEKIVTNNNLQNKYLKYII